MINEKEAELIGMHIGDGTLYKTNSNSIVWELRGSIHEQDYYEYVAKLLKEIFNLDIKPKFRGSNSYGIQTCNKTITSFFTKNGFKPGKKVYTVRIPKHIKSANDSVKKAFVRGLFDTDGCIYFDMNRTSYHYYPRIEFSFASHNLIIDLSVVLKELGFRVYCWDDREYFHIGLAGFENLEKWIHFIKSSNKKHINRIQKGLLNKSKIKLKNKSLKSTLS